MTWVPVLVSKTGVMFLPKYHIWCENAKLDWLGRMFVIRGFVDIIMGLSQNFLTWKIFFHICVYWYTVDLMPDYHWLHFHVSEINCFLLNILVITCLLNFNINTNMCILGHTFTRKNRKITVISVRQFL